MARSAIRCMRVESKSRAYWARAEGKRASPIAIKKSSLFEIVFIFSLAFLFPVSLAPVDVTLIGSQGRNAAPQRPSPERAWFFERFILLSGLFDRARHGLQEFLGIVEDAPLNHPVH